MKKYSPMLCPNSELDLETVEFPIMASYKLDGIRCIMHPELGMVSRSLKPIQNKQLQEKFKPILDHAIKNNLILDGEIYAHNRTFQDITRAVMTQDLYAEKKLRQYAKELDEGFDPSKYVMNLIDDMGYVMFDVINLNIEDGEHFQFQDRQRILKQVSTNLRDQTKVEHIVQLELQSVADIERMFEDALKYGFEGLILKKMSGRYKFGRSTINEALGFKVKPFETFDAKIIGVTERFENTNESFKNELGNSTKRNTVDSKKGTGLATAFVVDFHCDDLLCAKNLKVTIGGTEEFRKEIWDNKESYIGKMIEYKAMMIGAKDVPRHPNFVRFREDRDK